MITTNDLNITQDGIPVFDTATGSFNAATTVNNELLIGSVNNGINSISPVGYNVGNPIVNNGVGNPASFSKTPLVDQITINNLPSQPNDGANKQYVDQVASNFSFLDSTICATTANLTANYNNGASGVGATLTNAGTLSAISLDNYNPTITNRVLVKNQTDATQNGVYTVTIVGNSLTAWQLTRAIDYDAPSEITPGSLVSVLYGDTQSQTFWAETQQITNIGTDDIQFVAFGSPQAGSLLAVNNLSDVDDAAASRANLGLTNVATQTVTQFSLLAGDANSSIYSIPSGQSGQYLISNGSTAMPTWGSNPNAPITNIDVVVITTVGTYTYVPTANMKYVIVECVGGGGGGANGTNPGAKFATGSAGGYAKSFLSASQVGSSQICTVGAGGAVGQNGQNSSFGTLVIANGGLAGSINAPSLIQGGGGSGQFVVNGQNSLVTSNIRYFSIPTQSYYGWYNTPQNYGYAGNLATQAPWTNATAGGSGVIIITEFS